jgi:peptidoglycan hydrolase-like protein with peptidoglycan-binding domain
MPANSSIIVGPLSIGSSGDDVKLLQFTLNLSQSETQLATDGFFGLKTDAAVRVFQRSHGLQSDGIVGPKTASALGLGFLAGRATPAPHRGLTPNHNPSTPHGSDIPPSPHPTDTSAITEMVEALVRGLSMVKGAFFSALQVLDDLPDEVTDQVRSLVGGAFSTAISALRSAAQAAVSAGVQGASQIIQNAVRTALQTCINAISRVIAVLNALPDLLGLGSVVGKIREIITRLQQAVNGIIDVMIKTIIGAAGSARDAAAVILNLLARVAAAV